LTRFASQNALRNGRALLAGVSLPPSLFELDGVRKWLVGPALRAGRVQAVRKTGDREAILASAVTLLRISCSRPATERGPYLLMPALLHMHPFSDRVEL
jgi:hypothetical protein